jgi:RNA polymerase sigma factor for flagellar operon FliA
MRGTTPDRVDQGGEAANDLVRANLDLVGQVLARVSARYPRHVDREELWNAGALGLVEAAQRYDASTAIPFERYAAIRIRGAIIDSTRARDWASRSVRRRYRDVEAAANAFTEQNGRAPDRSELAKQLGVDEKELDQIRARSATSMLLSLDSESPGDAPPLRETVAAQDYLVQPEKALEQQELFGTLRDAVKSLPGVHGDVIRRYYLEGELLQDIAAELGVTQARVSQIRSEALSSMRAWFGSLYEGVPEVEDSSPGKRARNAYVAQLSQQSTWRSRLESAEESVEWVAATGA